jgi:predicted nucleic acid-binding Zn ribbon protein
MQCITGDGTMECGNCGFLNPPGELICDQCSGVVLASRQTQRSTYLLFLLLALMISFAALEAWLLF